MDSLVSFRQNFDLSLSPNIIEINTNYEAFKKSVQITVILNSQEYQMLDSNMSIKVEDVHNSHSKQKFSSKSNANDHKKIEGKNIIAVNPVIYNINIGNTSNNTKFSHSQNNDPGHKRNCSQKVDLYRAVKGNSCNLPSLDKGNLTSDKPLQRHKSGYIKDMKSFDTEIKSINSIIDVTCGEKVKFTKDPHAHERIDNFLKEIKPIEEISERISNLPDSAIIRKNSNKAKTPSHKINSVKIENKRRDSKGVVIDKILKNHNISFIDKIGQSKFVSEIVKIENWKQYNHIDINYDMSSNHHLDEDNQLDHQVKPSCITNPTKCCNIF